MFDFIPAKNYEFVHLNIIMVFMLFTFLHTQFLAIDDKRNINYLKFVGWPLLIIIVFYLGFRPLDDIFIDMGTYAYVYEGFLSGRPVTLASDVGFEIFLTICSKFFNLDMFFFVCACLYVIPVAVVSKKLFKDLWFCAFIMLIGSFSFFSYAVNGMRNGMATAIFLLALAYHERKVIMAVFFFIAINFHQTMMLPMLAFILTVFYNDSKTYLKVWALTIPLSLLMGGFWESFFATLGLADDRMSYLTAESEAGTFSNTGFRWDFVVYSATGVFSGWYFIIKRGFKDVFYSQLFNMYLTVNAFWILIIRANYSNRFAYLSWFMLALVIVYPFLKERFFEKQNALLGKVMLAYFMFTYMMGFILPNL